MHINSGTMLPFYVHVAVARLFITLLAVGYALFILLIALLWFYTKR